MNHDRYELRLILCVSRWRVNRRQLSSVGHVFAYPLSLTGDIAGMLAGAFYGFDAIPPRGLKALDPAVREAFRVQARRLIEIRSQ